MELKRIRVQNFKSVEDSEEFSIKDLTCLVGKNESGKTALLEALYKIKPDIPSKRRFLDVEFPRRKWSDYKETKDSDPARAVTTVWQLDPEDRAALAGEFGEKAVLDDEVTVWKVYDTTRNFWSTTVSHKTLLRHLFEYFELHKEEAQELENIASTQEVKQELAKLESRSERQEALLAHLNSYRDGNATLAAIDFLHKRMPTFVYFSDYHKLPGRVALTDLVRKETEESLEDTDLVFLALLSLVGTTATEIESIGQSEQLIAELEAVSARLTEEIFSYWSQNKHLEVDFRFDAARPEDPPPFNEGFVFNTRVRNKRHAVTVNFDDRSAGFVWFFSFLVWFSQMKRNYGDNLIILLDEPGLSLHARAQQDLLRYIREKLVVNHQVLYTTHSPFLIDSEDLLSVRTVEDVVEDEMTLGTKVAEDVLSTDADTLFPLQAALGYDITQTLFVGKYVLLVEGPSDLLYLSWASSELRLTGGRPLDERWTVTPAGGVRKVGSFMTLFGASSIEVAVLTDFSKGDKGHVRSLREAEVLKAGRVLSADQYVDQDEADIEDLIGRPSYVELVNTAYELKGKDRVPKSKPKKAPERVVKEVEEKLKTASLEVPEFNHYTPAEYLIENSSTLRDKLTGREESLERFQTLFDDLNSLLP